MRRKGNKTIASPAAGEESCRIAGYLIARGLPAIHPLLTAARRERLQEALLTGGSAPLLSPRRRVLIPVLAVAALAGVGMVWLRARPLAFEVRGGEVGAGGWVETSARERAHVRFSDGTSIAIAEASAGRVTSRTADGATFTMDRGRARFDVVHRAQAHWLVEAGPFEIAVTGTRFDVDWSVERGHALTIDLHAGSIVVRGALAGMGVPLRAGQRLSADLDRRTLAVVDIGDQASGGAGEGERQRARERQDGKENKGTEGASPAPPDGVPAANATSGEPGGDGVGERAQRRDKVRATRTPGAAIEPGEFGGAVSPSPAPGFPVGPAPLPARGLVPEPWRAPPLPADSKLAAGGAACLGWSPQVRFDRSIDGASVASIFSLAFTHPVLDQGRSWCGGGSLRIDARFDLSGTPNRFGDRPHHAGELLIELPAQVDLTDKTVSMHFFVEGPHDIRFGAQLFAVDRVSPDDAKWVGGGFTPNLTTGRWWTLTHTFERDNRLFEGGTSPVDRVEKLTLQIYAIGKDRVWTGRVFVDDLGWQ